MSRLKGKFLEDNSVDGSKIRLLSGQALRSRNAGDTADIDLLRAGATDILEILRETSMEGNKITNLADPSAPQDAVNLQTLEAYIEGVRDPKDAARVHADPSALPANTYDNGTGGVGATLTADANGALPSIDGVALAVGDRVFVSQGTVEQGIYEVTDLGSVGTPWILTRATDADGSPAGEFTQGMLVPIAQGTDYGGQGYLLATPDPITIGTTALTFVQFGESVIAGFGLNKVGKTLSVDIGGGLEADGNAVKVAVDDNLVTGSTKIDGSGNVAARKSEKEPKVYDALAFSNQYFDLARIATTDSLKVFPCGGPAQVEGTDYTVSYTGGTGGKTRVTLLGDLLTIPEIGDTIEFHYETLDY